MKPTADEAAAIVAALRAILSRRPAERTNSRRWATERSTSVWWGTERSTVMVDRRGLTDWQTTARRESIETASQPDPDHLRPWRGR